MCPPIACLPIKYHGNVDPHQTQDTVKAAHRTAPGEAHLECLASYQRRAAQSLALTGTTMLLVQENIEAPHKPQHFATIVGDNNIKGHHVFYYKNVFMHGFSLGKTVSVYVHGFFAEGKKSGARTRFLSLRISLPTRF